MGAPFKAPMPRQLVLLLRPPGNQSILMGVQVVIEQDYLSSKPFFETESLRPLRRGKTIKIVWP